MTPENQRIAIARVCGYLPDPETGLWYRLGDEDKAGFNVVVQRIERLPDYLNDLNTMHEAEKVLMADQQDSYQNGLGNLVQGKPFEEYNHWSNVGCAFVAHACALQRAEAFLKTLALWTED